MAVHGIDTMMWLTGERPSSVVTFGHGNEAATVARGDFDSFGLMLRFPSGLIGYVDSCRYAPYGYDQKVEVVGDKGAVLSESPRSGALISRSPKGDVLQPIQYSFPQRYSQAFKDEIRHFIDVVKGDATNSVSPSSVIDATAAILAAEKSARTNQIVNITY